VRLDRLCLQSCTSSFFSSWACIVSGSELYISECTSRSCGGELGVEVGAVERSHVQSAGGQRLSNAQFGGTSVAAHLVGAAGVGDSPVQFADEHSSSIAGS
jgi:hypothetical protein